VALKKKKTNIILYVYLKTKPIDGSKSG